MKLPSISSMGMGLGLLAALTAAEPPTPSSAPFKIAVQDGKVVSGDALLPIDAAPHIQIGSSGFYFGLSVDGKLISCSPQGSIWSAIRIDGQIFQPGLARPMVKMANMKQSELPPGPFGRKRLGYQSDWQVNKIHITQTVEIVPSKSSSATGSQRRLDTCRISYLLHNQDDRPHKLDYRASVDILINGNDGALYAAPTTHPGQVLNGVLLEGKTLPDYLQVLERPNLANPGFVATMTFKHAKGHGPNRVVLSQLGVVAGGLQRWDIPAQPAGDSACAIYWNGHDLKAGAKRELVWAYGGGYASDPENEGKVQLGLGGSFEPHKLFTITAAIDDPLPNQVLTLELPAGLERVEGAPIQPVPPPGAEGCSLVLWKGRVRFTGVYEIKVHSSTGTTQTKQVTIEPNFLP
jgi:hypothetical protein